MTKRTQTILALTALLVIAVLIRIPFLFARGYEADLDYFILWGAHIAEHGFRSFYTTFTNHSLSFPSYALYAPILWATTMLTDALHASPTLVRVLLKTPILLADLAIGATLFVLMRRYSLWQRLLAASAFLLNPAIIFAGVVWGQVDAVAALLLLLGVAALIARRHGLAGALFAIAIMMKPQLIALAPVFAVVALRDGWKPTLRIGAGALIVIATTTFLYFGVDLSTAVERTMATTSRYPVLSLVAWNIWYPFSTINGVFVRDDLLLFGILTPRLVGIIAVLVVNGFVARFLWRVPAEMRQERIIVASAVSAAAFFFLLTQMHERYLFAFFLFAPLLIAHSRPWRFALVFLSMTFFFNLETAFFLPADFFPVIKPVALAGTGIGLAMFALMLSMILFSHRQPSSV